MSELFFGGLCDACVVPDIAMNYAPELYNKTWEDGVVIWYLCAPVDIEMIRVEIFSQCGESQCFQPP